MERILESKLTAVTGWGTGAGVVFAWFGGELRRDTWWLAVLDGALATSTVMFFVLIVTALARASADDDGQPTWSWQTFIGLLLTLLLLALGWSLLVPGVSTRTASTQGVLIAGSAALILYKGLGKLLKRGGVRERR